MITSHGDVLMCCADWFDKSPVGDINKESIADIWNGKKYKNLEELINEAFENKDALSVATIGPIRSAVSETLNRLCEFKFWKSR